MILLSHAVGVIYKGLVFTRPFFIFGQIIFMHKNIIPTVGHIVHYFESEDSQPLPAIVVEGGDMAPCISVFYKDEWAPVVFKWSVQHKINMLFGDGQHYPYWEWPERN